MAKYKKPDLGEGPYVLLRFIDGAEPEFVDGPFDVGMLVPHLQEKSAWVLLSDGRPRVLRVLRQKDNILFDARSGRIEVLQTKGSLVR